MTRDIVKTGVLTGFLCVLAGGCASAPPAPPPAATAAATAAPAPPVTAAPAATAEAAPAPEEAVGKITFPDARCSLKADDSDGGGIVFRLSPGGAPFAQAGGSFGLIGLLGSSRGAQPPAKTLEVFLFDGQARSAGATFRTKRLRLSGHANIDSVGLHAKKPAVLGGFLVAVGVWPRRIGPEGIDAAPEMNGEITFAADLPSWHLGCDDLAIDSPRPSALGSVPSFPKKRPERLSLIPMGTPVPLSLKPGGKAVAELLPHEDSARVFVLEKRGTATRIAWSVDGSVAFGWVPSSSLGTLGEQDPLRPIMAPKPPASSAHVACAKDVALIAEIGEQRAEVGVIQAGTTIDVIEKSGTFARIVPPGPPVTGPFSDTSFPDVTPAPKASLLVRVSEISGCPAPVTPAPAPPEKEP